MKNLITRLLLFISLLLGALRLAQAATGQISWQVDETMASEADGQVTVYAVRTGGSDGIISCQFEYVYGTAKEGEDYHIQRDGNGDRVITIRFLDGDTEPKPVTLQLVNDGLDEDGEDTPGDQDEDIYLFLVRPVGAGLGTPTQTRIWLRDGGDLQRGTIEMKSATVSANEDAGILNVLLTRSNGSDGGARVTLRSADLTAQAGADFTAIDQLVSWGDGVSGDKTIAIPILDDALFEGEETFEINISNAEGAALGALTQTIATITENETSQPGTIDIQGAATRSINENGTSLTMTIRRTIGADGAVGISYRTVNGTALSDSDFTATSGNLSWASGNSDNKTISIPILNDSAFEGNELFTFEILTPTGGATLGAPASVAITINEDDAAQRGTVQFVAATYSVNESGPSLEVSVTRTGGSDGAISVDYASADGSALAGTDYTARTGKLNWADGNSDLKTISIPILNDMQNEPTEDFTLTLSNSQGGATLGARVVITIEVLDNDAAVPGVIQFLNPVATRSENGGSFTITVARTSGADGQTSVFYGATNGTAQSGSDYSATSGVLSWANGNSDNKTITIPILDDSVFEGDETLNLTLFGPTNGATIGAPANLTLTIQDNETAPIIRNGTLQFEATAVTIGEESAAVQLRVSRANGSDGIVEANFRTLDGSAQAGRDYSTLSGKIRFGAGDNATKIITIAILEDALDEPQEAFSIVLENPTGGAVLGGAHTAVVAIEDNDTPPPSTTAPARKTINIFNPHKETFKYFYTVATSAHVLIEIYNLHGELVRTLVDTTMPAGEQTAEWDGQNDDHSITAADAYLVIHKQDDRLIERSKVLLYK